MASTTRDQLLAPARRLFAERGFYGVSIANIADEHGLTKQALLHHYPSKEKLYGEVLKEISQELDSFKTAVLSSSVPPRTQLRALFLGMVPKSETDVIRTRLLMRELLDNIDRAETAGTWYLKPFLDDLVCFVKTVPGWSNASDAQALAFLYQMLGAVNYYGVSGPILQGIFGKKGAKALGQSFPGQLGAMMDAALDGPPS